MQEKISESLDTIHAAIVIEQRMQKFEKDGISLNAQAALKQLGKMLGIEDPDSPKPT